MRIGVRRDPALVLLFIFLTCGLYYLWFVYKVSEEVGDFLEDADHSPAMEVVRTLITCGFWNIYWDFRMGKRIAEMQRRVDLHPSDNSILYLILDLAGFGGFASLGLLNPLVQQSDLNKVWQTAMTSSTPENDAWPPSPRQPRPPLS